MNKPHHTWSDSPIHEQIRTMNDTPTPRTDAELFLSRGMGIVPTLPKEVVRVDFARKLERELTAVTEQRDRLAEVLQNIRYNCGIETPHADCYCRYCELINQIDEALQSLTNPNA